MRALAIATILIASRSAGAEPRVAERTTNEHGLAWQAPASCPDAASLHARIEHRLGVALDDILVEGIDVSVARASGRFVARVDLRALTVANDVRTLTSTRYNELTDAVAVIVARVARERAASPPVVAKPKVVAAAEPDAPQITRAVVTEKPPTTYRRWALGMRVSGVSGIGIVPEVGLGAELALTLRHDSLSGEVAETKWLTSGADAHIGGPARVDVGLQVTAVRVGWRPPHLPLRAFAAAEVGTMDGIGVNTGITPENNNTRWFAAGAGFGVAWQMNSWLRLVGTTEVLLAVERVKFALGNGMIVYAPSPMSARASCGIEIGWQ